MGNWRFVAQGLLQQNHDAQRLSRMISYSVVTVVSYLQDKMKIRRALFLSIQSSFFEDFMKAGILIYKDYVCENKKGKTKKSWLVTTIHFSVKEFNHSYAISNSTALGSSSSSSASSILQIVSIDRFS